MHADAVIDHAHSFIVDFEAVEASSTPPQHRHSAVLIDADPLAQRQLRPTLDAPTIVLIEFSANWGSLYTVAILQLVALEADLT